MSAASLSRGAQTASFGCAIVLDVHAEKVVLSRCAGESALELGSECLRIPARESVGIADDQVVVDMDGDCDEPWPFRWTKRQGRHAL